MTLTTVYCNITLLYYGADGIFLETHPLQWCFRTIPQIYSAAMWYLMDALDITLNFATCDIFFSTT